MNFNQIDKKVIETIRVLSMDAIQKANSGHPGFPIDAAPMAYTLWKQMRHNPLNPTWSGRDRFVLSAGHASMLEYSLLHLFGYKLSMDDIKSFRQFGSNAPGHPEVSREFGIESSSGPLGQGIATAVGMAMAEAKMASIFNRDGFNVVDNYTYVIMGDGCVMEGISGEAASLAGTLGLSKLIALYDRNSITIEGNIDIAFRENVGARYEAYGWHVQEVKDGENMAAIYEAIQNAKSEKDKPSLIIVNTKIAVGTAKEGLASAHGEPLGEENIKNYKASIGWNEDAFTVPEDVKKHFADMLPTYKAYEDEWNEMFARYKVEYPELAKMWEEYHNPVDAQMLMDNEDLWSLSGNMATRAASGKVINKLANILPNLFGGSADLGPSNKTVMDGRGWFSKEDRTGYNVHFGIREFAMAAACNGIMLYGGLHAYCATFMVFSDYLKPALRLSALMELPVIYVLTHDSIAVGEDGPTHQPIEQLAMLRSIPNSLTFRPADCTETVAGYVTALTHNMPTALILSRQNLPVNEMTSKEALKGGYILKDTDGTPDVIIMASGSEVSIMCEAYDILASKGIKARLVSMPCTELFEMQSEDYKKSVLPDSVRARVAVEAASDFGWYKYVGLDGEVVSINHFGASAPGGFLLKHFGFTAENVVAAVERVIK